MNKRTKWVGGVLSMVWLMTVGTAHGVTNAVSWAGGGDNNWSTASQWSPTSNYPNNGQPGAGDVYNVTFGNIANTAILNQNITINTLTFNGTAITNSGNTLTVNGAMAWANVSANRPQLIGAGTLEANSGIAFNPGGSASASNPSLWNWWTINLSANSTLGNSSGWYIRNMGIINVQPGATFSVNGDSTDAIGYSGSTGTVNILSGGTLNRITATTTTKVDNVVNNQAGGTIQVTAGGLWLNQGGTHAGSFAVAAGKLLQFGGTHTFNSGATVGGAGNVTFTGPASFSAASSLSIGGNTLISDNVSFADATTIGGTLTISGGTSAGLNGTGDITVTNVFVWNHGGASGSSAGGSGVVNALGGLQWSNGGYADTNGKQINLYGTSFIDGSSGWWVVNNGTLNVMAGATLELRMSGGDKIQGTGTINNQGTFFRAQGGNHAVLNTLNNTGTVRADPGGQFDFTGTIIQLSGTSITGGTWYANNGTINLPGSALVTIGPAAVIRLSGTGTINRVGTTLTTVNGGFYVEGGKGFNTGSGLSVGSTGSLGGDGSITGNVVVAGGTLAPGPNNASGKLTVVGNLNFQPGSTVRWDKDATTQDVVAVTGTLTLPAAASVIATNLTGAKLRGEYSLFTATGLAGTTDLGGWTVQPDDYKVATRNGNEVYMYFAPAGTTLILQ